MATSLTPSLVPDDQCASESLSRFDGFTFSPVLRFIGVGSFCWRLRFPMISKLPRWVWVGAGSLAFIAGMINAIGFLGFRHQGITHLTGTTTLLGIAIGQSRLATILDLLGLVSAFLTGGALSGYIIQNSTLRLGRRYGFAMLIESFLLFSAVPLMRHENVMGDYMASAACGLQNAMVGTFSGASLRTTHVSGIVTDLGVFLGHWLRGMEVDWRRCVLAITILGSFMSGAMMGAISFRHFSYDTLYFPATLTGFVGLSYGIYRHRQLRNGTIENGKT